MRKAGFWRWANRKAYNRLIANGRIWDYKSGDALAPVAEQEVEPNAVAGAERDEEPDAEPGAEGNEDEYSQRDTTPNKEATPMALNNFASEDNYVVADDLMSVISGASEISRFDRTDASSVSRNTSTSSASLTTLDSIEEAAETGWNTVGTGTPKPTGFPFTLKLSTNGGLDHLKTPSKNAWRKPMALADFSALSLEGTGHNDSDEELSPRTPRAKCSG